MYYLNNTSIYDVGIKEPDEQEKVPLWCNLAFRRLRVCNAQITMSNKEFFEMSKIEEKAFNNAPS